jgi:hypothetical protein
MGPVVQVGQAVPEEDRVDPVVQVGQAVPEEDRVDPAGTSDPAVSAGELLRKRLLGN